MALVAQETLKTEKGLFEVGEKLALGADAHGAGLIAESDHGRAVAHTVVIRDGFDAAGARYRDVARVVTEVKADHRHVEVLFERNLKNK